MTSRGGPDAGPIMVAEQALDAARELAHLTRPAITALNIDDLYALTGALAELVATMPQILTQISGYLDSDAAQDTHACLAHARRAAADLAAAADTTHQTLGNTAESIKTNHEGVSFQPT